MSPTFYQPFSCAVVHCGDVPAECIARVVGHDKKDLCERPLQDFRASGERPVASPRAETKEARVNSIIHAPYQQRGTEVNTRRAELYSEEGDTDL